MKKTTLKLWTEKGWLTLQPVTTANNVFLEDGNTVSQVLETLKNTTLKKNDEIVSTAAPYLISKFADNARRATLVLGEPYNDLDGTPSYGASLQSEKVSIQAYTIDDNGVKTTKAGVSAVKEGKVLIKGELCDEYGNPLIGETAGTIVTVNGEHQATWDADTKLDKITTGNQYVTKLYAVTGDTQTSRSIGTDVSLTYGGNIPQYFSPATTFNAPANACLISAEPTQATHVATKNYVDTKLDKAAGNGAVQLYAVLPNGVQHMYVLGTTPGIMSQTYIPQYWDKNQNFEQEPVGILISGNPEHKYHVANKEYVDTTTANLNVPTRVGARFYYGIKYEYVEGKEISYPVKYWFAGIDGAQFGYGMVPTYWDNAHGLPNQADKMSGVLFTATPFHRNHAANKEYVDTKTALYKTTFNTADSTPQPVMIYCNTHTDFSNINEDISTWGDLVKFYNNNLNFMLFEHIVDTMGNSYFIIDVYVDTAGSKVVITCGVAGAPLASYHFSFDTAIAASSSATPTK